MRHVLGGKGQTEGAARRVALISAAVPPQVNGAAIVFENVVEQLINLGWNVEVHVPVDAVVQVSSAVEVVSYESRPIGVYPEIDYPRTLRGRMLGCGARERPAIVHALTLGPFELLLLLRIRLSGMKTLVSLLTDFGELCAGRDQLPASVRWVGTRVCRRLQDVFFRIADGVHVLTESRAQGLGREGRSVYTIAPGVNPALVRQAKLRPWVAPGGCDPGQVRVVFVGRLSYEKGLHRLLDLLEWDRSILLYVIGDGPMREWLRDSCLRRGISERLRLMGELPHAMVLKVVAGMDVLVLPSRTEEFGLSALEALAVGIPVLSCTGPRGPEALARQFPAHVRVVKSWDRLSVLGYFKAARCSGRPVLDLEEWSWERMGRQLDSCYANLLRQGGGRRLPRWLTRAKGSWDDAPAFKRDR